MYTWICASKVKLKTVNYNILCKKRRSTCNQSLLTVGLIRIHGRWTPIDKMWLCPSKLWYSVIPDTLFLHSTVLCSGTWNHISACIQKWNNASSQFATDSFVLQAPCFSNPRQFFKAKCFHISPPFPRQFYEEGQTLEERSYTKCLKTEMISLKWLIMLSKTTFSGDLIT